MSNKLQTSSQESTKVYNTVHKITSYLDRTMPGTPEAAKRRRRIVAALAAVAGILVPIGAQAHNDRASDGDRFPATSFSGDANIHGVNLYDNPTDPETSSILRSSPDTGILGLSNKLDVIPAEIDHIETPSGVNEICNGETYRNIAGNVIERCWIEMSASDVRGSVSEINDQGQRDRILESIGSVDTVYVATDLASTQKEK